VSLCVRQVSSLLDRFPYYAKDLQHVAPTIPLATKCKAVSKVFVFALYRVTAVDHSSAVDFSQG
jgi:hypothetical protein